MENVTPAPEDGGSGVPSAEPPEAKQAEPGEKAGALGAARPGPVDDDAVTEALEQLSAIADGENERQKTTDAKLSSAQSAVGFIVTLAGGSVALAFLQTPVYDLWHGLVILALTVSVLFFVWAACKIVQANDPTHYQGRVAGSVRRLLNEGKSKQDLQLDAVNDLVSNVEANTTTTNTRLTLYRAAIDNIRKGVVAAGFVPAFVLVAYGANTVWGASLPPALRIAAATPSPSPTTAATATPTPRATPTPTPSGSTTKMKP